jgi:Ca-activated chloride channel family protein
MCKGVFFLLVLVCSLTVFGQHDATDGSLYAIGKSGRELGECPLKSTEVKAEISGFITRVNVRQEFVNSFSQPIEAVYMFPLSEKGAVDRMTMTVGDRVIRGQIMKRDEARQTYETAKSEGKTASLLDQERPNIFTQSVANIMPGDKVVIEISYVETLKYEDGAYEFVFPMVVGPRYIPGGVKDASRISSRLSRLRNGSDISIQVNLNAGVPVEQIRSTSHQIDQVNITPSTAKVTLHSGKTVPNKDFILRYDVTGKRIEDAVLTHRDSRGGFFTMILQPPDVPAPEDRTPKEIVFVLDTSGSMDGFPIEKAKETMKLSLDGLYPDDTFNLITFAGDTEILFDKPVPATQANLERARAFITNRNGSGGTEMMAAIKASLEPSDSQEHLRIVCFMTDGQVGNDDEIVAEVQKHPRARVFSFGIGDSVNRSLLDRIAQEGKGEATYIALEDDGSKAARQFYERVRTPMLTDITIDWNGMPVADVYPSKLTDLFSAKPVTVSGRFTNTANGRIKLRGFVAGQPYEREIALNLPENEPANDVLASLWARTRIGELSNRKLSEDNSDNTAELDKQITDLGLTYRLLTEFTSFVAVDDRVSNPNSKPAGGAAVAVRPPDSKVFRSDAFELKSPPPSTQGNVNLTRKSSRLGDPSGSIVSYSNGTGSAGGGGGGGGGRITAKRSVGRSQGSGQGSGRGSGYGAGNGSAMVNQPANVQSVTLSVGGSDNAAPPPPIPAPNQGVSAAVNVVGTTSEVVDVTASTIATNYTVNQIQALPVQGRSFLSLLRISRGVLNGQPFVVDGASGSENTFLIDGVDPVKSGDSDEHAMEGRVAFAVKPDSPGMARAEEVGIEIEVDALGSVAQAKAITGPIKLRAASEAAAKLMRFNPVISGGKPARLRGTVVYRFEKGMDVKTELRFMKTAPANDAELRVFGIREKLHFWLYDLVQRRQSGKTVAGPNESKFISSGRAVLKVQMRERNGASLSKLKAVGFEVVKDSGKSQVEGRIGIDKIVDLAAMEEVMLVVPKV